MQSFIQRHADKISGVLSGLDRVRFRGTLRSIAHAWGLTVYLEAARVLLKEFKDYAQECTSKIHRATEQTAKDHGRPFIYLRSSTIRKEELARTLAARDGITQGLVAVFKTVENCWSFDLVSRRGFLKLEAGPRKCLHFYHYFIDPNFGLMHARVQSWLPFTIHVCLNGRDWLARQMARAGIDYQQRDNCFVDIASFTRAQTLADRQVDFHWSTYLDRLAARVQPAHRDIFGSKPMQYFWSVDESEWATDIVFRKAEDLAAIYPRLVRYAIEGLSCHDVLRFLGRKHPERCSTADVLSDYQHRPEGLRIKYRLNHNALKMYDKQESVLRVETIVNNAEDFKVYRPAEGDENGPKSWRKMRKGVADIRRRAEVSQAANERLLQALANVDNATPVGELADAVCRPTRWKGRRTRALNPLAADDARLLEAISSGAFALNGFRNADLRTLLYGEATSETRRRQQSAAVTRRLRLLRAHGLIQKVAHTHRYHVSKTGRPILNALLAVRKANATELLATA